MWIMSPRLPLVALLLPIIWRWLAFLAHYVKEHVWKPLIRQQARARQSSVRGATDGLIIFVGRV
jgi:hypothetical protein